MTVSGVPRVPGVQKLLVVLLGAIGDVTRALPLLPRLRALYPEARIAWAVEPASKALVETHPEVDQVLLFARNKGFAAFFSFLRDVRAFAPDLCLDLQRHAKSGLVTLVSGARVRLGFHRANSREGNWLCLTHTIEPQLHLSSKLEQFQRFADWLGAPVQPITFGISPKPEEEMRVEGLLREVHPPFVTAFVGSSWPSRLWFPSFTAEVVDRLHSRGVATVIVGSAAEKQFAQAVRECASVPVLDLTGETNLRELFVVFRRSAAAFGPDCGPMHIAAAAGIPVVSLWGATSPLRSAPWRNECRTISGHAPCSPCYRKQCPIGRVCMETISPRQVIEHLEAALALTPRAR